MSVGAVGPVGGGAAGGTAGTGAASAAGTGAAGTTAAETTGTESSASIASNPVTSVAQMEINANSLVDFNSADLLIALLLMAAGSGKDEDSTGSTALGFLAGLAMANAMGNMDFSFQFNAAAPVDAGGEAAGGGQLNVTA